MDKLLKLAALLEKYWPLIERALPGLIAQLERVPETPKTEEPLVNPPVIALPPAEPKAPPLFSGSQLNLMDVNGEPHSLVDAIGWGSFVRLDSNPKDEHGEPLPAEQLAQVKSIEWKSLWDGSPDTAGYHHVNVGGALYNKSNGYACSLKVFKEGEDAKRHTLDVWVSYHLHSGKTVDSNEVRLFVD